MAKTSGSKKDASKVVEKAVAVRARKKESVEDSKNAKVASKSKVKVSSKAVSKPVKSTEKITKVVEKSGEANKGKATVKKVATEKKVVAKVAVKKGVTGKTQSQQEFKEEKPKLLKKNVKTRAELSEELQKASTNRFDIPLKFKKTEVPEFELPKFKTTAQIPYKPDYGRSILSKQKEEKEPEQFTYHRYSDAELEEFKEILQNKLSETKSELLIVQNQLSQGGQSQQRTHSMMEDSQMNAELEQLTQIARRYAVFIDNLEKALIRVENKTYGVCRATGKLIDKERLRVVPHATLSLEAKMKIVKNKDN